MAHGAFKVLDSDIHIIEPPDLWPRYIDPAFRDRAPVGLTEDEGDLRLALDGKPWGRVAIDADRSQRRQGRNYALNQERWRPYAERGWTSKVQLEAMDIEGIDVAVIYGTRGRQVLMHDEHDPAVAAALARAHNSWTYDFCQRDPRRLKFAAQLAFHDIPAAITEARRAVRELGAVAVIGTPNPVRGRHVHDPEMEPLWAAVEELGVPVGFHPTGQSSLRDDIARRYLDTPNGRVIGVSGRNPIELMMCFGSMAAGGVLERHPRLRCAFLEGTCCWLPWYLWRLDEAWEKFGPGSEIQISQLPSQYFFRQCYIATDADEKPLRQVIEAIGDDSIVVSTDYPHSDGLFPTAIEEFVRLEGVSDKSKSKILWDNCARLYNLTGGR
jgi:predicted TIM-barrel fold metal-dependent hydrolase